MGKNQLIYVSYIATTPERLWVALTNASSPRNTGTGGGSNQTGA